MSYYKIFFIRILFILSLFVSDYLFFVKSVAASGCPANPYNGSYGPLASMCNPKTGQCWLPFPPGDPWNLDKSSIPYDNARTAAFVYASVNLHPDFFGPDAANGYPIGAGIPYTIVEPNQKLTNAVWYAYGSQSDPGIVPLGSYVHNKGFYPAPFNAPVEGVASIPRNDNNGDQHLIIIQPPGSSNSGEPNTSVNAGDGGLYEMYAAYVRSAAWFASNGAIFDATSDTVRPYGWTSSDAAGLPVYPGLVKYWETYYAARRILAGNANADIGHMIRVTFNHTHQGTGEAFFPATHWAGLWGCPSSSSSPNLQSNALCPDMGDVLILNPNYVFPKDSNLSALSNAMNLAIVNTMKHEGMIVADNGGSWFFQGDPIPHWDNNALNDLKNISGTQFHFLDQKALQAYYKQKSTCSEVVDSAPKSP